MHSASRSGTHLLTRTVDWRVLAWALGVPVLAGLGIVILQPPLTPRAAVMMFTASAAARVLGVWREERRRARENRGVPAGMAKLVGSEAVIAAACAPAGRIRIGLEVWDARSADPVALVIGQRVVVQSIEGRTLIVGAVPRATMSR